MPRNPSSITHRGWAWDNDDQRLEIIVNGVEIAAYDSNGYAISGSGSVTQLTSKSTGVTLNNRCGVITTDNADIIAAVEVSFTVTNSTVAVGDVVVVNLRSGGTPGEHVVVVSAVAAEIGRASGRESV